MVHAQTTEVWHGDWAQTYTRLVIIHTNELILPFFETVRAFHSLCIVLTPHPGVSILHSRTRSSEYWRRCWSECPMFIQRFGKAKSWRYSIQYWPRQGSYTSWNPGKVNKVTLVGSDIQKPDGHSEISNKCSVCVCVCVCVQPPHWGCQHAFPVCSGASTPVRRLANLQPSNFFPGSLFLPFSSTCLSHIQWWKWSMTHNPENNVKILKLPLYTTKRCTFELTWQKPATLEMSFFKPKSGIQDQSGKLSSLMYENF